MVIREVYESHLSPEIITALVDGELDSTEAIAAEHHLSACPICAHTVSEERALKTLLGSLGAPVTPRSFTLTPDMVGTGPAAMHDSSIPPPPSTPRKISPLEPILRYISIAAVVALLILGATQLLEQHPQNTGSTTQVALPTETSGADVALQRREPAGITSEMWDRGHSLAAGFGALNTPENTMVPTNTLASALTPLEIATIVAGILSLAAISGWILIRYRSGTAG